MAKVFGRIIIQGDFGLAGVTTYIVALAAWLKRINHLDNNTDSAEMLLQMADDIFFDGGVFEPTHVQDDDWHDSYLFMVKQKRSILPLIGWQEYIFSLSDWSNYLFRGMNELFQKAHYSEQDWAKGILTKEILSHDFIFLLDPNEYRKNDVMNSKSIHFFLNELESTTHCFRKRIAIVVTKCEKPEIWPNRNVPKAIVKSRYPKTYEILKLFESINVIEVRFFCTSVFGVINGLKPNTKPSTATLDVIKDPSDWKPYGLFIVITNSNERIN